MASASSSTRGFVSLAIRISETGIAVLILADRPCRFDENMKNRPSSENFADGSNQ
jgi:hypothetical protein